MRSTMSSLKEKEQRWQAKTLMSKEMAAKYKKKLMKLKRRARLMKERADEVAVWKNKKSELEKELGELTSKKEENTRKFSVQVQQKSLILRDVERDFEESSLVQVKEQEETYNKLKNDNKELKSLLKKLRRDKVRAEEDIGIWSDLKEIEKGMDDSLVMILRSELKCPVCHDMFIQPETLRCGHSACAHCLRVWRAAHHTCPVCRAAVPRARHCRVLNNLVAGLAVVLPQSLRREREDTAAAREAERKVAASAGPPRPSELFQAEHISLDFLQALQTLRESIILPMRV